MARDFSDTEAEEKKIDEPFSVIGDGGKLVTLVTRKNPSGNCEYCYLYDKKNKRTRCNDRDFKQGPCSSETRSDKEDVVFLDKNVLPDLDKEMSTFGMKPEEKKRFRIEEGAGMKSFLAAALLGMAPLAPDAEAASKVTSSATSKIDKKTLEKRIQNVAKTIYTEAAGESYNGKLAVATIIWNRSKQSPWKGLTLSQICKQPKQFSGWNNGEPTIKINNPIDQKAWDESLKIATSMVNGTFKPLASLGSSNQYYNPKKASPSWGDKMKDVVYLGNHKFGKV